MRPFLAIALAALLPASAAADAPRPIVAMGAYVPTDDMERSVAFYRRLFDQSPAIELPDFVAFGVGGGWFAVVSRARYAPEARPGTGAVPYLQSEDLEALRTRLADTETSVPRIIEEPGIHILKITDPNGQLIEFFRLISE